MFTFQGDIEAVSMQPGELYTQNIALRKKVDEGREEKQPTEDTEVSK